MVDPMTLAVPVRRSRTTAWLFLAFAVAGVLAAANFVGYDGADDRSYALGAEAWLAHFPAVGGDHWATRHTVVLPVAAALALFGHAVWVLALPSLVFFAGLIWVNFFFARRHLGDKPAVVLALLIASTPAFVVQATYINNDIVETFFASSAFWLFVDAAETRRRLTLLLAGVAAGLSFLTRETSAVLVLFFAAIAAFDRRPARRDYLLVGLGFLLPLMAEMIFFLAATGDAFYRYRLDAGHDAVDRLSEFRHMAKTGAALDRQGNLSVGLIADPFLILFASQKFAALFWLAVPAAVWAWRAPAPALPRAVQLALIWIGFLALAFPILYLVPRYYAVPAWTAVVLVAAAYARFSRTRHARLAVAGLALLLVGNAASLYLENTAPRFAEQALVRWLATHPGTRVAVDPDMARRADLLLRYAGEEGRVGAGPPAKGALYVYSPRNLALCRSTGGCKGAYEPKPGWQKVDAIVGKPRAIGDFLRGVGLAQRLPAQIMDKLENPAPGIAVYRVR